MNYPDIKIDHIVKTPRWIKIFGNVLVSFFIFFLIILVVTPWQQTSEGHGKVIAIDPNDRVQKINSTVKGRVNKWYVTDGSVVKKGDPIVEIVDNDPNFVERLKLERDAVFKNFEAMKSAGETALLNLKRQEDLFKQGLSSRLSFEKAKIEYKKLLAKEAESAAKLANAEVKLSRQERQLIVAPRDGTILRILHGTGNVLVAEGDILAIFVPKTQSKAVEIYIDGNDLPLVYPGRHVRIQFEGWPAVQIAGWPSVAIGTFGGKVIVVDPSANEEGKFRVLITPDKDDIPWPDYNYLRQGTKVYAWVMLNSVSLGYELWRKFNGFPPTLDENTKENLINQIEVQEKKTKKKK